MLISLYKVCIPLAVALKESTVYMIISMGKICNCVMLHVVAILTNRSSISVSWCNFHADK